MTDPDHLDTDARPLLLDEIMPTYDVRLARHAIADVPPGVAFDAACSLDLLRVRTPLLSAAFWVRGLPERLRGEEPELPPRMSLRGDEGPPGWVLLGERPGREISFGSVGRFWQSTIEWRPTTAEELPGFDEPGWGKIACSFVVAPHGARSSLVTYECRTVTTDAAARRRFLRYWRVVRPFVGHIMQATVDTVAADAAGS
jgi:hypothetical protein